MSHKLFVCILTNIIPLFSKTKQVICFHRFNGGFHQLEREYLVHLNMHLNSTAIRCKELRTFVYCMHDLQDRVDIDHQTSRVQQSTTTTLEPCTIKTLDSGATPRPSNEADYNTGCASVELHLHDPAVSVCDLQRRQYVPNGF